MLALVSILLTESALLLQYLPVGPSALGMFLEFFTEHSHMLLLLSMISLLTLGVDITLSEIITL